MVGLVNVALYFQRHYFANPELATIERILASSDRG
jgi:hypothetical protein